MTLKGQTRDPNTLKAQYLQNYLSHRLQIWYAALYQECPAGVQIIFPKSGRGLGHVTTIFGIQLNISLKLHKLQRLQIWYAALTAGFCMQWSTVGQYGRLS